MRRTCTCMPHRTHQVNDLLEVHRHARLVEVAEVGGVVDELRDLVEAQLRACRRACVHHRGSTVANGGSSRPADANSGNRHHHSARMQVASRQASPLTTPRSTQCAAVRTRTCLARLPNTNSIASMTLDLPLPLGPTTDEKDCAGPTTTTKAGAPHVCKQRAHCPVVCARRQARSRHARRAPGVLPCGTAPRAALRRMT